MKKIILKSIFNIVNNSEDFKELEQKVFDLIARLVGYILKEILELKDMRLRDNRNKDRYELLDKRSRIIEGLFGELEIERRYYKDRKTGKNVYLLDEELGLEAYARKSPGIKEAALKLISDNSYRKTAESVEELTGGLMSHTAVHNLVQDLGEKKAKTDKRRRKELFEYGVIPEGEKEEIDQLFIEVDGVYVYLQEEDKERAELKLGLSYEGWEERYKGSKEYKTVNKEFYGGVFDQEIFWEEMGSKIYQNKELKDTTVVLNGDGASWIDKGKEYIPEIDKRELDSYHWNKKIVRKLGNSSYKAKIRKDIEKRDKESLKQHLKEAKSYQKSKKNKRKVEELRNYLLSHWEGLEDYREKDLDLPEEARGLGAMETNLDKVLANRMKKKGMSWSLKGARNLAKVVIAQKNGRLKDLLHQAGYSSENRPESDSNGFKQIEGELDELPVKQGNLPALEGPRAGRSWTKFLRNIR